jgi:hypothetical protein
MAKKKVKKNKTRRRTRRGMGGLSGSERTKRIGLLLTNVVAANLAHEGLAMLDSAEFMQPAAPKEGEEPRKLNIKKLAAHGGVMLGSGVAAVMIGNDYASEVAKAVCAVSSVMVKEAVVKPAFGMGSMDTDFLDLYKNDEPLKDLGNVQLAKDSVQLAGDPLMQKIG